MSNYQTPAEQKHSVGVGYPMVVGYPQVVGAGMTTRLNGPVQLRGSLPGGMAAPVLYDQSPSRVNQIPYGFGPQSITKATAALVVSRTQAIYAPRRLSIPNAITTVFSLIDVKLGSRSQFGNDNAVPSAVFSHLAQDSLVTFDTAPTGIDMAINANNTDTINDNLFEAAFIGAQAT